jgi:predicted DNA-binding transcriptional regulator AlpA
MSDGLEQPRRILRRSVVQRDYIPLGNTQFRAHENSDPDFPKRVPLSACGRAVGYFEDEVIAYQRKLAERRNERLASGS